MFDAYVTLAFSGAATYGTDYTVSGLDENNRLKFPAGSTSASFKLKTQDDKSYEASESITVKMAKAEGATLVVGQSALNTSVQRTRYFNIQDNDPQPKPKPKSTSTSTPTTIIASSLVIPATSETARSARPRTIVLATRPTFPTRVRLQLPVESSKGLIENALVFFDANFNGLVDYLDLNGNGEQDDDEPIEPSRTTGFDGGAIVTMPLAFDRNQDGQIAPDEGHWVSLGGVDTSTGLPLALNLTAPVGFFILTPLTTLVDSFYQPGSSLADAEVAGCFKRSGWARFPWGSSTCSRGSRRATETRPRRSRERGRRQHGAGDRIAVRRRSRRELRQQIADLVYVGNGAMHCRARIVADPRLGRVRTRSDARDRRADRRPPARGRRRGRGDPGGRDPRHRRGERRGSRSSRERRFRLLPMPWFASRK